MIRVNDKWDLPWKPGLNIRDLLEECGFTHHHIVVSVDSVLVPQGEFDAFQVDDGAQVRVIHVIGGG